MKKEEKLETIVKLFAKNMFYGDWKWETPNEKVIQMLMEEVGLYPFDDEDDMIAKTHVSDDLYKKANKKDFEEMWAIDGNWNIIMEFKDSNDFKHYLENKPDFFQILHRIDERSPIRVVYENKKTL